MLLHGVTSLRVCNLAFFPDSAQKEVISADSLTSGEDVACQLGGIGALSPVPAGVRGAARSPANNIRNKKKNEQVLEKENARIRKHIELFGPKSCLEQNYSATISFS